MAKWPKYIFVKKRKNIVGVRCVYPEVFDMQ